MSGTFLRKWEVAATSNKPDPDGEFVTLRECSHYRIKIERRLTRIEVLVSLQITMLIITLIKLFVGG